MESETPPPDPSSVFDVDSLLERLRGDRRQAYELAQLFLDFHVEMLTEVADAVEAEDDELIRETAHRIKGSLTYLHAPAAIRSAERLEGFRAGTSSETLPVLWKSLYDEVISLRLAIENFLPHELGESSC